MLHNFLRVALLAVSHASAWRVLQPSISVPSLRVVAVIDAVYRCQIELSDQRRPADGLERELNPPSIRSAKADTPSIRLRTTFELTREANAFKQAIESRGGL